MDADLTTRLSRRCALVEDVKRKLCNHLVGKYWAIFGLMKLNEALNPRLKLSNKKIPQRILSWKNLFTDLFE